MKNIFKGVIFDFDCTLVDSKQGMYQCLATVLAKMNYPAPTYDETIRTIGLPIEEKFTFLTHVKNSNEQLKFKAHYLELINPPRAFLQSFSTVFPEAVALMTVIKSLGCKIAIVSTKTRLALKHELNHFNLMPLVDVIQAGDDVLYPKPNPQGILNVLLAWEMLPSEILYIGDHTVDAIAAMSANVPFVGVTTGSTSEDELKKYPHVLITDHLKNVGLKFFKAKKSKYQ